MHVIKYIVYFIIYLKNAYNRFRNANRFLLSFRLNDCTYIGLASAIKEFQSKELTEVLQYPLSFIQIVNINPTVIVFEKWELWRNVMTRNCCRFFCVRLLFLKKKKRFAVSDIILPHSRIFLDFNRNRVCLTVVICIFFVFASILPHFSPFRHNKCTQLLAR